MCREQVEKAGCRVTALTSQEQWSAEGEARLGFTGHDLKKSFRVTMERLNVDSMNIEALMVEKQRVRRELQRYDTSFFGVHNRLPSQEEKEPMMGLYRYYGHLKMCLAKSMQQQKVDASANACSLPALDAPPGLILPPGLDLPVRPPPGLCRPKARVESTLSKLAPAPAARKKAYDTQSSDAIHADASEGNLSEGVPSTRIDWCIDNLTEKLIASRGGPVTSDIFEVDGMPDLRLIFIPGQTWQASKPNSKRLRVHQANMPKLGSLKLKCMSSEPPGALSFFLSVGSCPQGRFECDFAEKNVHECVFSADWLDCFNQRADRLELRLAFCLDDVNKKGAN